MNEGKKGFKEIKHPASPKKAAPKPRNPVAKNANAAIGGGAAGAHKDKKKAAKSGEVKHKKPADAMAENVNYDRKLDLLFKMAVLKDKISEGLRDPKDNPCWKGYKPVGTKKKGGRTVPNCVPKESAINEYETHTYKDQYGNVWRVNDEGDKELVHAAPGAPGTGYSNRYKRPRPQYRPQMSTGMYFYNVKPGQENDAMKAGLKQTKNGKWYSRYSNPSADKMFGPGRYWEPKSEGVSEGPDDIQDRGEYDQEGDMALDNLKTVNDAANELASILNADDNLPEWVQAKITKAMDYLDTARDYMKSNK